MKQEKGQPVFTREDVLERIKENGGIARGLDLSGYKKFVEGIDLSSLDLSGINLENARLFRANFNGSNLDGAFMQGAYLGYATFNPLESKGTSLQGVDLRMANLHNAEFREADLSVAQFQEEPGQSLPASLQDTDFRGANLFRANFKGCHFYGTKLEGAFIRGADITIHPTRLGEADWGNYKIGEEISGDFYTAQHRYRHLKIWYTESGYYDTAAEFYYREMEAKRKFTQGHIYEQFKNLKIGSFLHFLFKRKDFGNWVRLWIYRLLCSYGERPWQVFVSAAVVVLGLALIYLAIGTLTPNTLLNSLYYSAVSFTALGYGSWAPQPTGWVKGLGALEAFIGVFMMALFLVTFTKKMTR